MCPDCKQLGGPERANEAKLSKLILQMQRVRLSGSRQLMLELGSTKLIRGTLEKLVGLCMAGD